MKDDTSVTDAAKTKRNITILAVVSGIVLLAILGSAAALGSGLNSTTPASTTTLPAVASKPAAAAPSPSSPEDKIKAAAASALTGKNSDGKSYVREIDVITLDQGGYGVYVNYNGDKDVTEDFTKSDYLDKAEAIYKAIYTKAEADVSQVSVLAWYPVTDKYSKTSDQMLFSTTLAQDAASKVNWQAPDSTLTDNLSSIWKLNTYNLQALN